MVVEDGLAVGFEDGFGGQCGGVEVRLLSDSSQSAVLAQWLSANRECSDGVDCQHAAKLDLVAVPATWNP